MSAGSSFKAVVAPSAVVALMGAVLVAVEGLGWAGLLVNPEAFLLTFGGVALLVWSVYPWRDIRSAFRCGLGGAAEPEGRRKAAAGLFAYASECSVAMGVLVAALGVILVLGTETRPEHLGPRLAISLDAVLFGLAFSRIVFEPASRRLALEAQPPR